MNIVIPIVIPIIGAGVTVVMISIERLARRSRRPITEDLTGLVAAARWTEPRYKSRLRLVRGVRGGDA